MENPSGTPPLRIRHSGKRKDAPKSDLYEKNSELINSSQDPAPPQLPTKKSLRLPYDRQVIKKTERHSGKESSTVLFCYRSCCWSCWSYRSLSSWNCRVKFLSD